MWRGVGLLAVVGLSSVLAQGQCVPLKAPYGPENSLVSPNGSYALFGSDSTLWLENRRTHERAPVFNVTLQTLTLAWSPDSAAFVANDHFTSDLDIAYIYDAKTLDRLDLGGRIVAADRAVTRFVRADANTPPSHFHAIRWLDAQHVEVQLNGHTDGTWNGKSVRPGDCFDLRYQVSRKGVVRQLSTRSFSLDSKSCDAMLE